MSLPTKPLIECATFYSGGTPSKSVAEFWTGDIPWLTPKDMSQFNGSTQDCVSNKAIGNGTRLAPLGSMFIAVRGMSLHNEIRVVRPDTQMSFNQDIKAITPNNSVDGRFLYYALKARIPELLEAVEAAGHGTGVLPTDRLADTPIPALAFTEQCTIANLLGALDDKIELNRRMNETLEAMARAIFRDWFVDFGPTRAKMEGREPYLAEHIWSLFPDCIDPLGNPREWKIARVEDIAERIAMGPFGSNIKVSTFQDHGVPVISGQHLKTALLEDSHYNFISLEHAESLKNSRVKRGDVIFTHAGNIGQVSMIPEASRYEDYIVSQRQFFLRCDRSRMTPIFMLYFFRSAEGQHQLLANASSTGVPSISRPTTNLKSTEFCLPSKPVLDAFDSVVSDLHLKLQANLHESSTLAQTRDYLLPKLMSGEIRVRDAEKMIEDAA